MELNITAAFNWSDFYKRKYLTKCTIHKAVSHGNMVIMYIIGLYVNELKMKYV